MDPYKIHGLTPDSDYVSTDSGASDFDEEYWRLKPPPEIISDRDIMVITSSGKQKRADRRQKKDHSVGEYGIIKSYTRTRNVFSALEAIDAENVDSTGAQNSMNSDIKKNRRGRRGGKRIADGTQKYINLVTVEQENIRENKVNNHYFKPSEYSENTVNISNNEYGIIKSYTRAFEALKPIDPECSDIYYDSVFTENVYSTGTQNSINSHIKKNRRGRKRGRRIADGTQKYINLGTVEPKNVQENPQNNHFFNLEFSESIVKISNDEYGIIDSYTRSLNALKPNNPECSDNCYNSVFTENVDSTGKYFENSAKIFQDVYSNEIHILDLMPPQLSEQVNYENMLKCQSSSQLRNSVLNLRSNSCSSGTFDSSEVSEYTRDVGRMHIGYWENDEFSMPNEPTSYFKQIFKYLYSKKNAIFFGIFVLCFLNKKKKNLSKRILESYSSIRCRDSLVQIYFERSFHLGNVFE